jgi:hypothetical protein
MKAATITISTLVLLFFLHTAVQASTIWNGPTINFTDIAGSDPTQAANQDRLTNNVWITRAGVQGIYNAAQETGFTHFLSPADTAWANGTTANYASLTYTDWNTWAKGVNPNPPSTVGVDAVMHLISDDIYLDVKFTTWGGSAGGFSYSRSTPVPEPGTLVLLCAGAAGLLVVAHRKR